MSALRAGGVVARVCFGVAVLASLVILFAPGSDVPPSPPGVDKLVHGSLFAALALSGRWSGLGARLAPVVLLLYAAISEVIQAVAPIARDGSVADWLGDAVGVLVGLALWAAIEGRRRPTG